MDTGGSVKKSLKDKHKLLATFLPVGLSGDDSFITEVPPEKTPPAFTATHPSFDTT